MEVEQGYTFNYTERDDSGTNTFDITHSFEGVYLDDVADEFLRFIRAAGFTYVTSVVLVKEGGDEVVAGY